MIPKPSARAQALAACGAAIALWPDRLLAHEGLPLEPHDIWDAWTTDPLILIPLIIAGLLYASGIARLWRAADLGRGIRRWQAWSFAAGWIVLVVALVSPIHAMGEVLFSAHMVQHELMMVVAAPLIVLGRPLIPFVWALPLSWRQETRRISGSRPVRAVWSTITHPAIAWLIHAAALWVWHLPGPYQATLTHESVHLLQHASFLGSALLFWWSLLHGGSGEMSHGAAVLYVFTTMLHTGVLGALLTFSPTLWYPAYYATTGPWGLTPLEDQQLAGLIMWIPAGLAYLIAALGLLARWLQSSERATDAATRAARAAVLALIAAGVASLLGSCGGGGSREAFAAVPGGHSDSGKVAIRRYGCGACHTIEGVAGANGLVGPPLSGIGTRVYLAGTLPNTPPNMMRWIMTPRAVDSLTAMPNMGVTESDARHIAAYLYTLR